MRNSSKFLALSLVVTTFLSSPLLARKWTDKSGSFSVDAELVKIQKDHVELKRKDGTVIKVKIALLSKADQKYLAARQQGKPKASPTARIKAGLKQKTTLEFFDAPLNEVTDYLKQVHQIPIYVDGRGFEGAGLMSDTPVTAKLKNVPLGQALDKVLKPLRLTWLVRNDALIITTPVRHEAWQLARVYVPLKAEDGDQLVKDLQSKVSPKAWDQVGGAGSAVVLSGGMLVVSQSYQNHRLIQQLFAKRLRAVSSDGSRIVDHRQLALPTKVLRAPTSMQFFDTPLSEVVAFLSKLHKFPVELDQQSLEEVGLGPDSPVIQNLKGIRLSSALNLMLGELGLRWTTNGKKITISTPEALARKLKVVTHDPVGGTPKEVAEMLTTIVRPDGWSQVGGPGTVGVVAGKLKIKQSLSIQIQIARLLDDLKKAGKPAK